MGEHVVQGSSKDFHIRHIARDIEGVSSILHGSGEIIFIHLVVGLLALSLLVAPNNVVPSVPVNSNRDGSGCARSGRRGTLAHGRAGQQAHVPKKSVKVSPDEMAGSTPPNVGIHSLQNPRGH
ncbi:hypothetical protein R1flu_017025 [Riccia fluitans]|uniref:Uncharacterized protein n=1 Tax=Riccia fluitans TaxID=41844 RepID=A0ABD1YPH7_9MARC